MTQEKVRVPDLARMKAARQPITMLTAYDFPFARIFDNCGVDVLLIGDSLGMAVRGEDTTLAVTIDEVIYHTRAVARARRRALIVADMPFLSYQVSPEDALRNAGRLVKEGGAEAVKLEGGVAIADAVARIAAVDIPVMGHVGLTPQSIHRMGGHRVQGRKSGRAAGCRERSARRRTRARGRGRIRDRGRRRAAVVGARDNCERRDPNYRNWRRPGLRRPGARDARHARPVRVMRATLRQAVRAFVERRRSRHRSLRARSQRARVPGAGTLLRRIKEGLAMIVITSPDEMTRYARERSRERRTYRAGADDGLSA